MSGILIINPIRHGAVDNHVDAGGVRGAGGGNKNNRVGDFLGCGHASHDEGSFSFLSYQEPYEVVSFGEKFNTGVSHWSEKMSVTKGPSGSADSFRHTSSSSRAFIVYPLMPNPLATVAKSTWLKSVEI